LGHAAETVTALRAIARRAEMNCMFAVMCFCLVSKCGKARYDDDDDDDDE
jgi:hypothetical protein